MVKTYGVGWVGDPVLLVLTLDLTKCKMFGHVHPVAVAEKSVDETFCTTQN